MNKEAGTETGWDAAMREGRAQGIDWVLGIGYKRAWLLARDYWRPRDTRRVRVARWLLRKELPRTDSED